MRVNQSVIEITGSPAQVWGNVLIPARGKMGLKIKGDILQTTHMTALEKKESWTRIQNIDSIELMEAPIYPLLVVGAFFCLIGLRGLFGDSAILLFTLLLGIALVLIAIVKKRRYLAIMSHRNTIAVFMNRPPEIYQQFATNLLLIARQLNNQTSSNRQQSRPEAA